MRRAIYAQLLASGYPAHAISVSAADTFADEDEFFSHRREALRGLRTGRMIGFLGLREVACP